MLYYMIEGLRVPAEGEERARGLEVLGAHLAGRICISLSLSLYIYICINIYLHVYVMCIYIYILILIHNINYYNNTSYHEYYY